jgi:hypothetical protein
MKAAYISHLKNELKNRPANELLEICLRLAKFKKENKELITYLLFEMEDEQTYIESIKEEVDKQFEEINTSNVYFAKKSIRKILRNINKFNRYSGIKQTEVELLLHFCKRLKGFSIPIAKSMVLSNIFDRQIEKIQKSIKSLHEDLQFDYGEELKDICK